MQHLLPLFLIVSSMLAVLGCGPKRPSNHPSRDAPRETMMAEPIHVKAELEDGETGEIKVDAYDASGLFERAATKLRLGECLEAVLLYGQLVDEFSSSPLAPLALYNSGLCNEQLTKFQNAASNYLDLIKNYPESRDVTDAMFRLAGAYEKLEAFEDVTKTLSALLSERVDLEGIERVEALARQGVALNRSGKPADARVVLEEASFLFRTGQGVSPSASTFYHGMARFELGEILRDEMRVSEIPGDEELVEAALEKKCRLLLDAQKEYTQTIKIAHPHWAAAAAYGIGNLYRSLFDDMVNAPVPDDLDEEAKKIYLEVLKDRIRVLLSKAVVQWERTLKMARRLNLSNEWVDKTTAELEEIRQKLALEEVAGTPEQAN